MNSENLERSVMEKCLNKELHTLLILTRDQMEMTQACMAKRYFMAKNNYSNLEGERQGFSALTMLLLLNDQEDPKKVVNNLVEKLNQSLAEVTLLI